MSEGLRLEPALTGPDENLFACVSDSQPEAAIKIDPRQIQ